jgi:hypothetical protein
MRRGKDSGSARWVGLAALGLGLVAGPARAVPPPDVTDKEARIEIGEERFLRIFFWNQFWARFNENNPGSVVRGEVERETVDVALRRTRFILFGQVAPRLRALMHVGINNQGTEVGGFGPGVHRPQLFFHDVWGEYRVLDESLYVGAGLVFWGGPSRLATASTITFLGLDAPIFNWPAIDRLDQFGRTLGVYAKGKLLERFDYRVSFTQPFVPPGTPGERIADFDPRANTFIAQGYFKYDFLEVESNILPFAVGTWLGKKRVLNVGAGFYFSPGAMAFLEAGERRRADVRLFSVDGFTEQPLGGGSSFTGYASVSRYDFGPNYVRSIGILNPSPGTAPEGPTSFNGPGNAVPLIGTGWLLFAQVGYLLPDVLGRAGQLQPYISFSALSFERLADPVLLPDVGCNWYLVGQHAKLTLNYRGRPVFQVVGEGRPEVTQRRSEVTLQAQVYF